jgi:hypothetical protein
VLLRFRVTNFASIRNAQELSMVALDDHPKLAITQLPLSKERVLPVAGIFGANASGKSNLIKAAGFARRVVIESHQRWLPDDLIPRWPFLLDSDSRNAASDFVFEFVHDRVRYEYGFSLDDETILEEWLFSWPRGRRLVLFERSGLDVTFGASLTGHKAAIVDLMRENSLFLSAAAANNHPLLRSVASWFGRWQQVTPGGRIPQPSQMLDEQTLNLLRYADVGVIGSAMARKPPPDIDIASMRQQLKDEGVLLVDHSPAHHVELLHQAQTDRGREPLPWTWESSGTQAWLHLSRRAAGCLQDGAVLTIDDLGGELHPLLSAQLVGLFQDPETNPHGAQLIFTGHDVNLLGRHVEHRLHRDQVWLTEKTAGGASRIYPLTEYGRVRDGVDDVEGRYLQGRYGAVPFFDKSLLAGLLEEPAADGS